MEMPEVYAATRARTLDLVGSLPAADLDRPVPGTPGWTVTEVLAHLVGVAADVAGGRTDGAGTPPWTAAQVAARKGATVAELADEWTALASAVDPVAAVAPRMAFDALVHEHDIRGALGLSGPGDEAAVDTVLQSMVAGLGHRLEKAGAPALRLVAEQTEWIVG